MSTTHRIRRQRWQINAASASQAFALRTTLRRESELSLQAALEAAFDACDDGQHEIHLQRLEVTVRVASAEQLAEQLPARLGEAARLALAAAVEARPADGASPTRPEATPAGRLRRYLGSGQIAWFEADRDPTEVARQLTAEARRWSLSPPTAWPGLLADLPAGGVARSHALLRFLQLLDDQGRAAWWDFAEEQAVGAGTSLATAVAELHRLQAGRPADHALRLQALALLLVASGRNPSSAERSAWSVVVQACAGQIGRYAAPHGAFPRGADERLAWQKISAPFAGEAGEPVVASAGKFENSVIFPVDRGDPEIPPVGGAPGVPVHSAGLVLLHPYLLRLFSGLGWVTADHRPGDPFPFGLLPRAAALLHWLATGRDEAYEFELGCIKLLLGLDPDAALPVAAGLVGEAEKEEGGALLAAVVGHWTALGKTSINGLRVSFLQRGGLLYPASDGWLLRLQAESFDILLDRLPWGIAYVRLPWMTRSLHSAWPSA